MTIGPARRLTRGVAIFSLIVAPAIGAAENWVPVGSTDDGKRYFLDTSSVVWDGAFVRSWVKHVEKRTVFSPLFKKSYSYWIEGRIQDCNARSAAMTAAIYRDKRDRTIANYTYPQAEWKFFTAVPGSVGESMLSSACALALRQRDMKPRILNGSLSQGQWRSMGYDLARTFSVSVKVDSIVRNEANIASVVVKSEYPRGAKLSDGREYHTVVSRQLVDCNKREFDTVETEFYSIDGRMVDANYKTPSEIQPIPIEPRSFAAAGFDVVCSAPIVKPVAEPSTAEPTAQATKPGNVKEEIGFGTGWVSRSGYVVTAYHVVENAKTIALVSNGEVAGTASIVASDPANDIAVLRPAFSGPAPAGLPMTSAPVPLGARVFTLGFPQPPSMGFAIKFTAGEVSSASGVDPGSGRTDDVRLYQISAAVHSGNSGGPVFNSSGQVIGIVSSKLIAFPGEGVNETPQNVNFAIKARYVEGVLADLPPISSKFVPPTVDGIEAAAERARNSILMIVTQ